jgi:hypothetical protein
MSDDVGGGGEDAVDVNALVPSEAAEPVEEVEEFDEEPAPEPEKKAPPKPKAEVKPEKKAEAKEPEKPAPKPKRVVKGKVDGVEQDIELDDEDYGKFTAKQMRAAAQKSLQEAAQARKEVESFVSALKQNPADALKRLGVDPVKWAEDLVLEHAQTAQLSPEQRAALEWKRKAEELEAQQRTEKERLEHEETERETERIRGDLDRTFAKAAEGAGLKPHPYIVARMARIMRAAAEDQDYDLSPEEAATQLKDDLSREHAMLFDEMEGSQIVSMMGDKNAHKVRKFFVEQVKAKRGMAPAPKADPDREIPPEKPKSRRIFSSPTDFADHLASTWGR